MRAYFLIITIRVLFVYVYQSKDFTECVFKYQFKKGSRYSGVGFPYKKGDVENQNGQVTQNLNLQRKLALCMKCYEQFNHVYY